MEISGTVLENIVKQTVDVGDVYIVEMDQNDGITLHCPNWLVVITKGRWKKKILT